MEQVYGLVATFGYSRVSAARIRHVPANALMLAGTRTDGHVIGRPTLYAKLCKNQFKSNSRGGAQCVQPQVEPAIPRWGHGVRCCVLTVARLPDRHNGMIERHQRLLADECLYARAYASQNERRNAISVWKTTTTTTIHPTPPAAINPQPHASAPTSTTSWPHRPRSPGHTCS